MIWLSNFVCLLNKFTFPPAGLCSIDTHELVTLFIVCMGAFSLVILEVRKRAREIESTIYEMNIYI